MSKCREMRLVFLNDSKERILNMMEKLAGGEYDNMIENEVFASLREDKERIIKKLNEGLNIEEAFNEIFIENVNQLKELLGDSLTDDELIEAFNEEVAMDDEMVSKLIEAAKEMLNDEEMELFNASLETVQSVRMELV